MQFVVALSFSNPQHYVPMAQAAEACGWDWAALSDHVVHPERMESKYPYTTDGDAYWDAANPWPDVWVSVGAMAASTSRLKFMTNVYVLPARHPLVVAKAVGTAAVLSHDRVALGIGVGWMKEEFEALGQDFHTRGKRTNEAIEILRALWGGGMVEHRGEHYSFDSLQMSPAPSRQVPIFVGGISKPALRRAASCDGWISVIHSTEEIANYAARLRELRADAGKADDPFELFVSCDDASDADGFRRLQDAGATGAVLMPWTFYRLDPSSLDAKIEGIKRFAADVIHKLG